MPGTVLNMLHILFHLTLPTTLKHRHYNHTEQRRSQRHRGWLSDLDKILQLTDEGARIPDTRAPEPVPEISV